MSSNTMFVAKLPYPATGLASVTRSSSELITIVCHPPPDRPETATRSRIDIRQCQPQIQGARHCQVKRGQPACAAQVELVHAIVREAGGAQLPHAEPLQVQHQHAALGQVDRAELLVLDGLALGRVTVDVHGQRNSSGQIVGQIEQAGNPHAGQAFVAKLADSIARSAGDRIQPLDAARSLAPAGRRTAKHDLFEHVAAQPGRIALPVVEVGEMR